MDDSSHIKFPRLGMLDEDLLAALDKMSLHDANYKDGKTYSLMYFASEELHAIVEKAFHRYFSVNALNPTAFPSMRKFETETVSMVGDLLGGDEHIVGNITTGGTESILMTVKTAREHGLAKEKPITSPNLVMSTTTHPAFNKAAYYLGVEIVAIPVQENKRADVAAMKAAINENTILIVASAPSYPHGVIDPVTEIAQLALAHNILCHVDACIGGFMLPFVKELGYPIPDFDFSVPGVTSISTDLHKYGYSAKGTSLILYKNSEIRKKQFYVYTDWPGGIYASPTLTGSRPGATIAASWAVLKSLGFDGYREMAKTIMETTDWLKSEINAIPQLSILSDPDMSIMAIVSEEIDVFELGDEMSLKGWYLDRQQFPNSLHLTISHSHAKAKDDFIKDLRASVATVSEINLPSIASSMTVSLVQTLSNVLPKSLFNMIISLSADSVDFTPGKTSRMSAMYGISANLDDRGDVEELVLNLLDRLYKTD